MTPDQNTLEETFIEVGDGHTLYVQSWGNPKGMPVIFVHGGPGGHSNDKYKQQFNPNTQHVIFYDQRGCGRSLPFGSLEHNTTAELINDLDKIAKHFNMRKFVLLGESWGACLALAYAIEHPEKVKAILLAGVFTGSQIFTR
jgi:proline iminopeptidase